MDIALLILLLFVVWLVLRARSQARRIALLGRQLANLNMEQHMQTVMEGYVRTIHEPSAERQAQIWPTFAVAEQALASQTARLAQSLAQLPAEQTRVSRWSLDVPYVEQWLPAATRDFRPLVQLHAQGLQRAVDNAGQLPPKDRAFVLMAELLLLQHSCHWFCKSRGVADARLVLRHQVTHEKVLDSVSAPTQQAYRQWLQT